MNINNPQEVCCLVECIVDVQYTVVSNLGRFIRKPFILTVVQEYKTILRVLTVLFFLFCVAIY